MWIILSAIGWICGLLIAWQDFHRREIHLTPLLVFGLLGGLVQWREWGNIFWQHLIANVLFVGLLLGSILLYFRLRGVPKIMDVKFGWGDVVMLLCLSSWLKPIEFLLLYSFCTSLLSIIYGLLRRVKQIDREYPIPLAGWLALAFLCWSIFDHLG